MSQYWCPKDGDDDAWIVLDVAAIDFNDVQPCPSIERERCRECRWVPFFVSMKVEGKEYRPKFWLINRFRVHVQCTHVIFHGFRAG